MMKQKKSLRIFNLSVFFQAQIFLLPVLFLFYQHCGLSVADFFLFQGVFSLAGLLFEIPAGYLGDIFPKKNVLILSYSFFIARLLLWLFFMQYGYWILFIGEVLYAAQKATFSGASDSYIYEYLKHNNIPQKMLKKYGKLNFSMSIGTALSSLLGAWLYHSVSQWSMAKYQQDYGFVVLIGLELVLNITALVFLLMLPKIPRSAHPKRSLKELYSQFFRIIVWTAKNKKIRYHMVYSGVLVAMTSVFVWSFQPIMKLLLIPVAVYGLVYFVNHTIRALASLYLNKTMKLIPLSKLSVLTFLMFIASFVLSFIVLNIQPLPLFVNLIYFVFVSFAIGAQLSFFLSQISRFHHLIPSEMRTTVSSINTATGRLWSGFFFVLLKILMDGVSIQISLGVCLAIFLLAVFPLKKLYQISASEEKIA